MNDYAIAQLRRLYLHALHGGVVMPDDLSHVIARLESVVPDTSARRWELRALIAMAICDTPDITMNLEARASRCVCKETGRPVSDHVPRCLDCLGKADAALRLLDQLEQQSADLARAQTTRSPGQK